MKKRSLTLLFSLLAIAAVAQQKVFVKGKAGNQYIEHKVGEKESLSSIGRIYDITASQLARYNGRSPSSVLSKGVVLKVPFKAADMQVRSGAVAVYHRVAKGDNLFKLGQTYNKVPVTQLRSWNKLGAKAGVQNGQELLVGYFGNAATAGIVSEEKVTPAQQTEVAIVKEREDKPEKKEQVVEKQVASPVTVETEKPKVVTPPVADNTATKAKEIVVNGEDSGYVPTEGDEGYFARLYIRHDLTLVPKSVAGSAATFKTVSGWTDRKYYVMINGVTPGTIVRITATNNKSICARVLSALPEVKGAEGLLLRLSNSAASALGLRDESFNVNISYFE